MRITSCGHRESGLEHCFRSMSLCKIRGCQVGIHPPGPVHHDAGKSIPPWPVHLTAVVKGLWAFVHVPPGASTCSRF